MAKRKKAQPWDAVFDRVRIVREPKAVPHPLPTDEQVAEVEKQLGHRLPASYREFALRFGLHGGCARTYLASIHDPVKASRALIPNTNHLRKKLGKRAQAPGGWDRYLPQVERLVFFTSGSGVFYAWDPTEITHAEGPEYRVYHFLYPEPVPIPTADSFWGFVAVLHEELREWYQRWEPPPPETIPFKPYITRNKTRPAKSDAKLWLAWNNNTARDLALSIRDRGQTDAFPILADALQEAGCTNADLLDSCRTGDPEIDGVWVLQVLLGKAK